MGPDDYPKQHEGKADTTNKSGTFSFSFDIPISPVPHKDDEDVTEFENSVNLIQTYDTYRKYNEMFQQMVEERTSINPDGFAPWKSHREAYTHILERLEDYWAAVKMPVEDNERAEVIQSELVRIGAAVFFALCEPEV